MTIIYGCKSCGWIVPGQNDNPGKVTRNMKRDLHRHVLINHPEEYRNIDMALQKKGFSKKIRDQMIKEVLR